MNLLIIGATGLVGLNLVNLISESDLEIEDICFVATSSKIVMFRNKIYNTVTLEEVDYSKYDICCITSNSDISKKIFNKLLEYNYTIIDNSSAFRDKYKLTIPELNFEESNVYINPNCCVIQCTIPLFYLNEKYKIKKIIYNTYQSLSGAGRSAINNKIDYCIPKIGEMNGNTSEENKLINETKSILNNDICIIANCVRVPVLVGHLVNIIIEIEDCTYENIYNILNDKTIYLNDVEMPNLKNDFNVYTMRLKQINNNTFSFYTYSNNLLRGSSYNTFLTLYKYNKCLS